MTFEEAKKRSDYHFRQRLGTVIDGLASGRLDDMDADSEPFIAGAVLEIGCVDLELNISVRAMFDNERKDDKTPVPEYFCCVKFGEGPTDWDCDGYILDESKYDERAKVKVDWKAENWVEQLERDMFDTLVWYADLKGYSFDELNTLKDQEHGKVEPKPLDEKERCIIEAREICRIAWGWSQAVGKDIAIFNKTRILAELDSAEDYIREIRKYVVGLDES